MTHETKNEGKTAIAYIYTAELDDDDTATLQKTVAKAKAAALGAKILACFEDQGKPRVEFFKSNRQTRRDIGG